jgi:hypothetical protein
MSASWQSIARSQAVQAPEKDAGRCKFTTPPYVVAKGPTLSPNLLFQPASHEHAPGRSAIDLRSDAVATTAPIPAKLLPPVASRFPHETCRPRPHRSFLPGGIVSSLAVSSQASQPHAGKASVHQRPARTLSPGNVVKVTVTGAAFESRGTSLTLGRATAPTSNSLSRPWPSIRSTSNDACSCASNVSTKSCRGRNRSGFVTRE